MKHIVFLLLLWSLPAFAGDRVIYNPDVDGDIKVRVNDGGSVVDALTVTGSSALLTALFGAAVDGSSDIVQLRVQGNGTQTNDIMVVEKSDGTDVFHVDNSGRAAVGNGTTVQSFTGLTVGATTDNVDGAEIAIVSPNNATGQSILNFGDTDSRTIGRVKYNHNDNSMELLTNSATAMTISSTRTISVGSNSIDGALAILQNGATNVSIADTGNRTFALGSGLGGLLILRNASDSRSCLFFIAEGAIVEVADPMNVCSTTESTGSSNNVDMTANTTFRITNRTGGSKSFRVFFIGS